MPVLHLPYACEMFGADTVSLRVVMMHTVLLIAKWYYAYLSGCQPAVPDSLVVSYNSTGMHPGSSQDAY